LTRTLRAYNKHPLLLGPGYRGWITSNKIPEQNLFKYTIRDYHPWQQWGRMRGWKDYRIRTRRRQAWKRELASVKYYESDTYYFLWHWGYEEVIEGLFGDYLAERALAGLPVKGIY